MPLELFDLDSSIKITPNSPRKFECYKATKLVIELILSSGKNNYRDTSRVVISSKLQNNCTVEYCNYIESDASRNLNCKLYSIVPNHIK
nr:hypothetical protein GTC16762_31240 [Pigmentibacter ruber]